MFIKKITLFIGFLLVSLSYVKATIRFTENKGQWNDKVLYRADFNGGRVFLEESGFSYVFCNPEEIEKLHGHEKPEPTDKINYHVIKTKLLGANHPDLVESFHPSSDYQNYFLGNDPSKWTNNVRSYNEVWYRNIYDHVDMKVYSQENYMKYDFVLNPGADYNQIQMHYDGSEDMLIRNGKLVINTSVGEMVEQKPYAWQLINGRKKEVACNYYLVENTVRFRFPKGYNESEPLVIDPTLVFSTFTGSTADNWGSTAAYDNGGNAYTAGIVFGFGYPLSAGAFQSSYAGGGGASLSNFGTLEFDMSVSKFNVTGTNLIYSTYIGGSSNEVPNSIVTNNQGELFLSGVTESTDFPTTIGAFQVIKADSTDIVVLKLGVNGDTLISSTFVGGDSRDGVNINYGSFSGLSSLKYNHGDDVRGEINIDNNDNVYVVNSTRSNDFPTTPGSAQPTVNGGQDAIVFKLNQGLSNMLWGTYLGGTLNDAGYALALDNNFDLYVTGGTESSNFLTTSGSLHNTARAGIDGFLTHLSGQDGSLINSTYIGTGQYDQSYFVQTDKQNNPYVYGQTEGNYPVSVGVYSNANSGQFLHKITPDLSTTLFSTVIGSGDGNPDIVPSAFLVDNCSNIYIAGWGGDLGGQNQLFMSTNGLPVTANAYQSTTDGSDFYFLVLDKDAQSLEYATFFGGGISREHVDGGTSRFDKTGSVYQAICAGCGGNSDMHTTPNAWSNTNNSLNCNNAVVKFDLEMSLVVADVDIDGDTVCAADDWTFENISAGAASYSWDFGDNTFSTAANPTHQFLTPGDYEVIMIASNPNTCNLHDTVIIPVHVKPTIEVSLPPDTTLCEGETLLLNANTVATDIRYAWSNGSTGTSIVVPNVNETYWIYISDGVCDASDTIHVAALEYAKQLSDSLLCEGDTTTLIVENSDSYNYLWSTGDATNEITVTETDIYYLSVTLAHCITVDSADINFIPFNAIDLGNDTLLCPGETLLLDATSPGSQHLWSMGSTSSSITVDNTPGVYWVDITKQICHTSDTIEIYSTSLLSDIQDTTICAGDIATLNAKNVGSNHTWSTGEIGLSIETGTAGDYWVDIQYTGCIFRDSGKVFVTPLPVVNLGNDTVLCPGDTLILDVFNHNAVYNWSTNDTISHISISRTDTIFVNVFANACENSDTLIIVKHQPITLGNDVKLCGIETVELSPGEGYMRYVWSTGANTESIIVNEQNTYWVNVFEDHCSLSDTMDVINSLNEGTLYVPNAFTPNDDDLNKTFAAKGDAITEFSMLIFDRWGDKIYEAEGLDAGWDGRIKDKKIRAGLYVYKMKYKTFCSGDIEHTKVGHVSVLY